MITSIFTRVKIFVAAQAHGIKTHSATKKRWTALANGGFKRASSLDTGPNWKFLLINQGHAGARHGLFKKSSSRLSTLRGTAYANPKQKSNLRKLLPNG